MDKYKNFLMRAVKPARYAGEEYNSCDYTKAKDLSFCLCFPEPYEVAMSNLGIKILYHMLNDKANIVCERCFMPWTDMIDLLTQDKIELFSIESKSSLKAFDIIGFSMHYELCFTNVLKMFDLSNIPFYAKDRDESYPLIIAGGPATLNPEPFADFFDIIVIGEGEEALASLCDLFIENKKTHLNKQEFFKKASKISGVYIPSMLSIAYNDDGTIKEQCINYQVKKAYVSDVDNMYFPTKMIMPSIAAVHDRAIVELYRGCSNGCRFCQAGFITRPIRHKSHQTLFNQACELVDSTGYQEVSLSSLSSGDYPDIIGLLEKLKGYGSNQKTNFALPSLRMSGFVKEFLQGRNNSITFAPEAGSQRLRDVINKNITEQDIKESFSEAFKKGCSNLKLYFMTGLPTETIEDIKGIESICHTAKSVYSDISAGRRGLNISVSCSVFIPKAFTPFQWEKMDGREETFEKQSILKKILDMRGVRFSYHDYETSKIEAVFARGDRSLSKVIVKAYQLGALFDGWSEFFNYKIWEQAFSECGIDMDFYLKEISPDRILPWDFIDIYLNKDYLLNERQRAYSALKTMDCRDGCRGCGANFAKHCHLCKA